MTNVAELAEMLRASRRDLLLAVESVTADCAVLRPGEGEWSVLEVLAHLVDTDYHYADEALAMRDQHDHMLAHFDDNAWKLEHRLVNELPLADVLASLKASHDAVLGHVLSMTDAELDLPGLHPRGIPYSVRHVVLRLPPHDENHTRQIEEILASI